MFYKKGVLRNFTKFTGKHLCQSPFFKSCRAKACNFIKKEILTQVFSCELCEISKNTLFTEHPWTTAFVIYFDISLYHMFLKVTTLRSTRSQIFFKIGILKNFSIFTGKHRCESLFLIKLQAWKPATLLKRVPNFIKKRLLLL